MKMERVHDCLDGKISRSQLTEEELEAFARMKVAVDETLAFVREKPSPDVRSTVMQRIAEVEAGAARAPETAGLAARLRDALQWIWAPRTVRLRPAWALAGLAVLALAVATLPLGTGSPDAAGPGASSASGATVAAGEEPTVFVRFELDAQGASSVRLAGNFTGWEPRYELAETRPGEWSALVPLEPGVHDYAFVVDGERWMADPDAIHVDDGFGGVNSRIALVAPEARPDVQS